MKKILIGLLTLTFISSSFAGRINKTCTNHGNTVEINYRNNVVTYYSPSEYSYSGEIPFSELKFKEEVIKELPSENSGCTSRQITIKNIRIKRRDGIDMPHAYNRIASRKGDMVDVFICNRKSAWMGRECPPVHK